MMKKNIALIILTVFGWSYSVMAQQIEAPKTAKDTLTRKGVKLKELPPPESVAWMKDVMLGQKLFDKGSIYNGLAYFEEALRKNPKKTDLLVPIADGNFQLRDYKTANHYYKMLVDLDSAKGKDYYSLYQYALTEKYLGEYEEAKTLFDQFVTRTQGVPELADYRKKAALESEGCTLGIQLRDDKKLKDYVVEHLDNNINQPFTDYAPFLSDRNTLYYGAWVSDDVILQGRTEKYATFSRIYQSKRNGDKWSKSVEVPGAVDTVHFHTGNAVLTPDRQTMYYTQCYQDDKQRMRCNIYKSHLENTGWSAGDELSINAKGATTTQPALGEDEAGNKVLFFSSDRNPANGMDIYEASINSDGTLQAPRALSNTINTTGDEMTPFYDESSHSLFFSSNGLVNIGGLDIYQSSVENGQWTTPKHLGLPINSSVDDMYYTWNDAAKIGFFVSNRPGGFGLKSETCCDDIYQFRQNIIYLAVRGTLLDADSNKPMLHQDITLYDAETGQAIKTVHSDDGSYFFDLKPDKKYKLSGTKKDYFTAFQNFTTEGITKSDTLTYALDFKKMVKNKAYTLNNIYYDFGKWDLTEASKLVLDTLYTILQENPAIVIELSSHTDSKGTEKYNMELSQKRAESCVNYLINEKNLPKDRITAKGYGESMPVAPNENPDGSDNPDGRAKNRRTEFKITGEVK